MYLHQRHVACSVSAPPMIGPRDIPACDTPMTTPYIIGRFSNGEAEATIVNPVVNSPDAPMPPTARPTMSMVEDWAEPQMALPTAKKKRKAVNTHYRG